MKLMWRLLSAFGIAGGLVAWSGTGSEAAPIPRHHLPERDLLSKKWDSLRESLDQQLATNQLSQNVLDALEGSDFINNLREAVDMSYAVALPNEIETLDDLWLEVLIEHGDSKLITEYLAMRSVLDATLGMDGQAYMERWLWQAQGMGDCDNGNGGGNNGHGNGDQDAPGNSGDNNNAENSENSGEGNSGQGNGGNNGNNGNNGNGGNG